VSKRGRPRRNASTKKQRTDVKEVTKPKPARKIRKTKTTGGAVLTGEEKSKPTSKRRINLTVEERTKVAAIDRAKLLDCVNSRVDKEELFPYSCGNPVQIE